MTPTPDPYDADAIIRRMISAARRVRAQHDHTQIDAEKVTGIPQRTISKFEIGAYKYDALITGLKLAKGYRLDPIIMMFGDHTISVPAMAVARAWVNADKATQQAVLDLLHLTSHS